VSVAFALDLINDYVRSKNPEVSNISHQKLLLSNLSKALQNGFHYAFSISSTIGKNRFITADQDMQIYLILAKHANKAYRHVTISLG
jgi:hypothetical protein